ncbi:MAG: FHA domain-containing protein [Scytonema sp. PMC 1069.18]|nr:FHA domain-containing protein [Scytonema sp. PMC 1069.18]MEC4887656.1 FHA domain-containing protein [Scytonema sp. PMC 1070.18]
MQNTNNVQTTNLNLELFHIQSQKSFNLLPNFSVVRIGKPKEQYIPDINVSDLPNANFVSRLHAEIQAEKNDYYLVDLGSANGTYLNNMKLEPKKRYQLNLGDKIDLSHGGKVTFLFLQKQAVVPESDTMLLNEPPTVLQIELFTNTRPSPIEQLGNLGGWVKNILDNSWDFLKGLVKK